MQIGVFIEYAGMVYDEYDEKEHKVYGVCNRFLGTKDKETAEKLAKEIYNNLTDEEKEMQLISVVLYDERQMWPIEIIKFIKEE